MEKLIRFLNFLNEARFGNSIFSDFLLHNRKRMKEGSTKLLGFRTFYVDSRNFITCRREIFRDSAYSIPTDTDQKEPIIIDCGANIGVGIIYLKDRFPNSKVIAIEPDPLNFEVLKKNMQSHNLSNVTSINKAVWVDDQGILFRNKGNMESRIVDNTDGPVIQIETVSLIEILQTYHSIFFLKIDIEGAEIDVLKSAKNHLSKCKYIFVEYHSIRNKRQELQHILSIFSQSGFRYYIEQAAGHNLERYKLQPSNLSMEFQLNLFCYKI